MLSAPAGRRVALINTYSMREAARLVAEGTYPAHHLWGCATLPAPYDLVVGGTTLLERWPALARFPGAVRIIEGLLGDPFPQAWALRQVGRDRRATIFAASHRVGPVLCLLRRLGVLRAAIIVLVHSDAASTWTRLWLRGADRVFVFTDSVRRRLIARGVDPAVLRTVPWGPDLRSPLYARSENRAKRWDLAAAGKDNRDYAWLREYVMRTGLNAVIFDGVARTEYVGGREKRTPGRFPYAEVIDAISTARAVVIPIANTRRVTGLTELADALALRVPVIVSRTEHLPFDVERVAVGAGLDSHDAAGLNRARSCVDQLLQDGPEFASVLEWYSGEAMTRMLVEELDALSSRS